MYNSPDFTSSYNTNTLYYENIRTLAISGACTEFGALMFSAPALATLTTAAA